MALPGRIFERVRRRRVCRRHCSRACRCAEHRAPSRIWWRRKHRREAGVSGCGRGAASSAWAAPAPRKPPPMWPRNSDVRIGFFFCGSARMGDCPIPCGTNGLCVFPEIARGGARLARLPFGPALRQFLVGEFHVDGALDGIDRDDVAVLESPIGPPTAASGPTWPMQKPRVAPEKRPSVMSATLSPMPWP